MLKNTVNMEAGNGICIVINQNIIINVFTYMNVCICYSLKRNLKKILYKIYIICIAIQL